jgi:hypothetical protein
MTSPEVPVDLLRLAPPPRKIRYARCGSAGAFELPRLQFEEEWSQPVVRDGRVSYRRVTRQLGLADERIVEDAVVAYGPDGLVDLGVYADGVLSLYDPPQVVLPPNPEVGASWSAEHQRGDRTSRRSVELVACTLHKQCVVSVAEIKRIDGVLVLRTHFVEGDGWSGYEALVQAPGRPSVRTWTDAVSRTVRSSKD